MKVELREVGKSFLTPGAAGETVRGVTGVTLTIVHGESCLIHGPSGSGKSTLLSLIGGLAAPTTGEVFWDSARMEEHGGLARFRGQRMGYALQEAPFFPELTAMENLLLPAAVYDNSSLVERAETLMELFGLADRFDFRPPALSGGEKRRLNVARALLKTPDLLILDEPTSYLDDEWRERVMEIVAEELRQSGATLVVASHDATLRGSVRRIFRMTAGEVREE